MRLLISHCRALLHKSRGKKGGIFGCPDCGCMLWQHVIKWLCICMVLQLRSIKHLCTVRGFDYATMKTTRWVGLGSKCHLGTKLQPSTLVGTVNVYTRKSLQVLRTRNTTRTLWWMVWPTTWALRTSAIWYGKQRSRKRRKQKAAGSDPGGYWVPDMAA